VATMEPGMAGLDELMKRADQALYEAKAGGRNRIAASKAAAMSAVIDSWEWVAPAAINAHA
jgi:predicted signal transduction protein with EAL and GGDEF domain